MAEASGVVIFPCEVTRHRNGIEDPATAHWVSKRLDRLSVQRAGLVAEKQPIPPGWIRIEHVSSALRLLER